MSADNGIYIGRFMRVESRNPLKAKFEYRVIHAQAIENCDDSHDFPSEITDAYRALYYGGAPIFTDADEAHKQARELVTPEPILEYGISEIHYDIVFPSLSKADAEQAIDKYWKEREVEKEKERDKEVAVKCLVTKGMLPHECLVMVQDYPALTPILWRGYVSRNWVRVHRGADVTDEGYYMGVVHAHKVKEEVREVRYNTTALQYLIEFPDGIPSHSVWVEPRMVEGTW